MGTFVFVSVCRFFLKIYRNNLWNHLTNSSCCKWWASHTHKWLVSDAAGNNWLVSYCRDWINQRNLSGIFVQGSSHSPKWWSQVCSLKITVFPRCFSRRLVLPPSKWAKKYDTKIYLSLSKLTSAHPFLAFNATWAFTEPSPGVQRHRRTPLKDTFTAPPEGSEVTAFPIRHLKRSRVPMGRG